MSWRDEARPRIAAVIKRVGTSDLKALAQALRDAFPWGQKTHHPYKIWRDEVRRQLGLKQQTPAYRKALMQAPAPGQRFLFSDEKA